MRTQILFVTILTTLVLAGCGGSKLATVKVTGTVTFDGQPLEGASISFTPQTEGQGHPGYAITDSKGEYKLQTMLGAAGAGTTPGVYLVAITCVEKPEVVVPTQTYTGASGPGPGESGGTMGPPPPAKSLIPEWYGNVNTSGLTATVEKKKNNVIDFDLTSN